MQNIWFKHIFSLKGKECSQNDFDKDKILLNSFAGNVEHDQCDQVTEYLKSIFFQKMPNK